jgi:hypothetical protein
MQSKSKENFHLPRYFCEYTKKDDIVSEGGLIYVPENSNSLPDGDKVVWPRSWDYYADYQSTVLLGPPRQGKTSEFKYQCKQVENGFFLPLRGVIDSQHPEKAFDDEKRWSGWLNSNKNGELFIDSLDEGNLRIE